MSKNFKTAAPVNKAIVIVIKEVRVAMPTSFLCSASDRPSHNDRNSGMADMLLATAKSPNK
jgi:hypothetical protein